MISWGLISDKVIVVSAGRIYTYIHLLLQNLHYLQY